MINIKEIVKELDTFRMKNGIQWKRKLKESLLNGTQREPKLIQFRNRFDFDLLNKIKYTSTLEEIEKLLTNYKG